MISDKLLNPASIVVVGASNELHKPGGKLLFNLKSSNFRGNLYVVNPRFDEIQGVKSYRNIKELPQTDCALIAIPPRNCLEAIEILAFEKKCRGFVIVSAGFSELNKDGAEIEDKITEIINSVGGTLIGPNCIGFLNQNYIGTFDSPIPQLNQQGIDMVTASGAIAVYTKEECIIRGLQFNSIWSVGNSPQTGVEDVLEHWDNTFKEGKSSKTKIIYMEGLRDSDKFFKHASSLVNKGCKIAAIKSGITTEGSRAVKAHTGSHPIEDLFIEELFKKSGIIRCRSRQELINVSSIFSFPEPKGRRIAVITHAGGSGVMLTDSLTKNGFEVPEIPGNKAEILLPELHKGSSVQNPIDFLATGTAEQLGLIIDACENEFDNIDAMAVIFGSPGLFPNYDVYRLLNEKMNICKKPVYPIIPSIINAKDEIKEFTEKLHRIYFTDETLFGEAFAKVYSKTNQSSR